MTDDIETTNDLLKNLSIASQRKAAEELLKAQNEGLRVSITEPGAAAATVGTISDIRVETGRLVFKVNGEDYRPFLGLSVEILGKCVDSMRPEEVLQSAPASRLEEAKELLQAQMNGQRVSITEAFSLRGRFGIISNVRIECGELVFNVDGQDYRPASPISPISVNYL
jgi:mRNA-degrading endonuclease HigB of HigAB toxin-antitoxin module